MEQLKVFPVLWDSRARQLRLGGEELKEGEGHGYDCPRTIHFDINKFKNLVKWIDATLVLTPSDDSNPNAIGTQHLHITTHCQFGWFFNLFISRKMYKNTVEWRIQQFLENLRNTAEHKPLQQINIELE